MNLVCKLDTCLYFEFPAGTTWMLWFLSRIPMAPYSTFVMFLVHLYCCFSVHWENTMDFFPLIRNCLVQPQALACWGLAFTISPSSSYLGCCHATDTQVVGILLIVAERILSSNNVQNSEAKLSCCWKSWWQVWAHSVEFLHPLILFWT